jgi:hypothetical protein
LGRFAILDRNILRGFPSRQQERDFADFSCAGLVFEESDKCIGNGFTSGIFLDSTFSKSSYSNMRLRLFHTGPPQTFTTPRLPRCETQASTTTDDRSRTATDLKTSAAAFKVLCLDKHFCSSLQLDSPDLIIMRREHITCKLLDDPFEALEEQTLVSAAVFPL